jgi:hypothetical protein
MNAPTVALSAKTLSHFPDLRDPTAILTDSFAAFAKESALLGAAITPTDHNRAWIITGTVMTLDGILLIRVARSRKKRRRIKLLTPRAGPEQTPPHSPEPPPFAAHQPLPLGGKRDLEG